MQGRGICFMEFVDRFFRIGQIQFGFPGIMVVSVTRPLHKIFQFSSFQSRIKNFFHFVFGDAFDFYSFRQGDMLSTDWRLYGRTCDTLMTLWILKLVGSFNLTAFGETTLTISNGPNCRSVSFHEGRFILISFVLNQTLLPTLYSGAVRATLNCESLVVHKGTN